MCKVGNKLTPWRSRVGLDRWDTFLLLNAVVMAVLKFLGLKDGSRDAHLTTTTRLP